MPDWLVRFGIRMLLRGVLKDLDKGTEAANMARKMEYVKDLKTRAIAEFTADANKQHYEVPAAFYDTCLGPNKKYSCGWWPADRQVTLEESETLALQMVCDRARITKDKPLRVLDMGCGWGSFTLYVAAQYPNVRVTGVSNSGSQRAYILGKAAERGLKNVEVVTADINVFDAEKGGYDRVVSIEMMEHAKNYEKLLRKVSTWLKADGLMFVHIFTHTTLPFHYDKGWMAENFFSGGQMPSDDLLLYFQQELTIADHWVVDGRHYEKTSNAWLETMDRNRGAALKAIESTYGAAQKTKWLVNWRLFFLACAELFGYANGQEWQVSHYLFQKKA